jgi:hypothetical protein
MLRSLLFCNNTSGATASMTVAIAPDYIEESFIPNGGWTSSDCVPTVTGGTSPYTYTWSRVGGGSSAISLAYTPTTKDMAFFASGTNQRYYAMFKCLVTDSSGTPKTAEGYVEIAVGFNVSAYPEGSEPL